jgi:acetyl-CoA carboxylase carboxyl transferase subunit beta
VSWLSEVVRPKLRELVGARRDIPDNLWHKCPGCGQMIFHRDLESALQVCQHCGHHMRITARRRLELLLDEGFRLLDLPRPAADPLRFRDLRRYSDRLKEAQGKTGLAEAVLVAEGAIGGQPAVTVALDFAFMGGSMGVAVGSAVVTAARAAVEAQAALIVVAASGGARMQEGILSLMQMASTTVAIAEVKEAGLPYIAVLTDPTTGGVSASFAMLGDIAIAEPGAVIGFAGARVIEQTIRESLPEGFQRAEYLLEHGMIDMVVPRSQLRETLVRVLHLLRQPLAAGPGDAAADDALPVPAGVSAGTAGVSAA